MFVLSDFPMPYVKERVIPGWGATCRTDLSLKIESSVRSNLLRRNPLQEHIVKVHAPVKRFDSDALIFSMCTDVVAIILFA